MPKTTETPDVTEVVNEAITNLEIDAQLDATVMRNIFLAVLAANTVSAITFFGVRVVAVRQLKKFLKNKGVIEKETAA